MKGFDEGSFQEIAGRALTRKSGKKIITANEKLAFAPAFA